MKKTLLLVAIVWSCLIIGSTSAFAMPDGYSGGLWIILRFPKTSYAWTNAQIPETATVEAGGADDEYEPVSVTVTGLGTLTPATFPIALGETKNVAVTMPAAAARNEYRVTLTVRKKADHAVTDTKTATRTVYIVKVASLVPSEGTEIDDGDGNANTKSYIVPVAATGEISVIATAEPDVPPELFPTEWSTTGGVGYPKNPVHTVSKTTAGSTTVTTTCGASSQSVTLHVFSITITSPAEGSKATFNNNTPAVKDITCTCTVNPAAAGTVTWTCDDISGVTESWPNGQNGNSKTLRLTNLPSSNASFGTHHVTATLSTLQVQANYKLFFPGTDNDKNHPGDGAGTTPNWFFYWKATNAGYGTPYYKTTGGTQISYVNNNWRAYLTSTDNNYYTPPDGDNQGNNLNGIDNFAWTCRHEGRHVTMSTTWYPNDYDAARDPDGDWIPDGQEPSLGGTQQNPINGGPFTAGVRDTDADGMRDDEDFTCYTQAAWTEGNADGSDWSNPGHQY